MPAVFDNSIVTKVQEATDIVDLISEYVSLSPKGREMAGICPFHEDHRPSMYVNSSKQIFKCFACGAGGDVFKFVQMRENLTFPQAVERLAERAGIEIKRKRTTAKATSTGESEVDANMLARVNKWAMAYFQKNLNDPERGKQVRDYLAERQINQQSICKWNLGLAVGSQNDLLRAAEAKRIPLKLLHAAGLVVSKGNGVNDKFVNRLMFPISDAAGRVIGFGGRTLDGANAKYLNSPSTVLFDKSNCLYGLENARPQIVASDTAVIVEGYTDCIMPHQAGCSNVVATLGTSFTAGHARILRRYAKRVVLLFDNDTAGMEASNRALEVCLARRLDIKLASVPEGKDPCDYILAAGKEDFDKLIASAEDVFDFKWRRLTRELNSHDTLEGKKRAIDEFLSTVAQAMTVNNLSPTERGLVVNRLSRVIGIEVREINEEINKAIRSKNRNAGYVVPNQKVVSMGTGQSLSAKAQRELLEVLLNEPKLLKQNETNIPIEAFEIAAFRQIAEMLFSTIRETECGGDRIVGEVLRRTESVEISNLITGLAHTGEKKGNFESRLADAVEVLKRCKKEEQSKELLEKSSQDDFLVHLSKNVEKYNPHRLGMV